MRPDGRYDTYDKRHLFRMAQSRSTMRPARTQFVVRTEAGGSVRSSAMTCDSRSGAAIGSAPQGYDVLLYVANWPERRRYAWQTLLSARAIENLSYCIGVNRAGRDSAGIDYCGDSTALDFLGQPLCPDLQGESVVTVALDYDKLNAFRARFPAYLDADDFTLQS